MQLPEGDQEYQLRGRGQSRPELVELRWSSRLKEQLEALRDHTDGSVSETAARLGRLLADFIHVPGWTLAATQVAEKGDRELTALTVRSSAAELYLLPGSSSRSTPSPTRASSRSCCCGTSGPTRAPRRASRGSRRRSEAA